MEWTKHPPRDIAQITISIVVPRKMMSEVPHDELTDAVRGVLGENVLHTLLGVSDVRDEVYSHAKRRKSFDDYMNKASKLLQPLVDYIGGEVTQTGGGSLAIILETMDGDRFGRSGVNSYILVTDTDGPLTLPSEVSSHPHWTIEGREYAVGVYREDGLGWVSFAGVSYNDLPEGIKLAHLISERSKLDSEESYDTFEEAKEHYT